MDPKHRDRVAFVRLCSGRFQRGMKLNMVQHTASRSRSHSPIFFFARDRELAEEAWPGDVIGIPNHGVLRVGDALSEGEPLRFAGMPNFAPEILQRVRAKRPDAGQAPEGRRWKTWPRRASPRSSARTLGADCIVGVVGPAAVRGAGRPPRTTSTTCRSTSSPRPTSPPAGAMPTTTGNSTGSSRPRRRPSHDRDGNPVYLARNGWDLGRVQEDFPKVRFTATRERH